MESFEEIHGSYIAIVFESLWSVEMVNLQSSLVFRCGPFR